MNQTFNSESIMIRHLMIYCTGRFMAIKLNYVLAKFSFLRSLFLVTRATIKECSWIHRDGSSLKAATLTLFVVLHEAVGK
jgi:hypothetical protein